jgi:hypothetical protein
MTVYNGKRLKVDLKQWECPNGKFPSVHLRRYFSVRDLSSIYYAERSSWLYLNKITLNLLESDSRSLNIFKKKSGPFRIIPLSPATVRKKRGKAILRLSAINNLLQIERRPQ